MFNRTYVYNSATQARSELANRAKRDRRNAAHKQILEQNPGLEDCLQLDHRIIADIADRFQRYGKISAKQIALVYQLASQAYAPKFQAENAKPVPEGRHTVRGEIVSLKLKSGYYGDQWKILVKSDYKVWGTLPAAINDAEVGDIVEFSATLKRSDKDQDFGFFSRPTKARIV